MKSGDQLNITSSVGLSADSTFLRFVMPSSSESLDDESALDSFSLASFNSLPKFGERKIVLATPDNGWVIRQHRTQFDDVFVHFLNRQVQDFPQVHLGELAVHFFGKYPCRNG